MMNESKVNMVSLFWWQTTMSINSKQWLGCVYVYAPPAPLLLTVGVCHAQSPCVDITPQPLGCNPQLSYQGCLAVSGEICIGQSHFIEMSKAKKKKDNFELFSTHSWFCFGVYTIWLAGSGWVCVAFPASKKFNSQNGKKVNSLQQDVGQQLACLTY